MDYWYDIVRSYDRPKEKDRRKDDGSYSQTNVVILLMYLLFGGPDDENDATKIAEKFSKCKNKGLFKIRRGSALKSVGKVSSLLKKMREDKLVIGTEDEKDLRKMHNRINPKIIQSLIRHQMGEDNVSEIPLDILEEFLMWIEKSNKDDSGRNQLIESLSSNDIFDYLTFLIFLEKKAVEWEQDPKILLEFVTRPKLSQLIEEYIEELEKDSEIEPRLLTKILSTLDDNKIPDTIGPKLTGFGGRKKNLGRQGKNKDE